MPLPPPPPPSDSGSQDGRLPPPPTTTGQATCYRHPARAAGRRCTRCGRPACESCLVQANVGSHCVECVQAAKPDVRTRARHWQASKPALVTYALIAVNVAAFVVLGLVYDPSGMLSGQVTEAHWRFGLNVAFVDGTPTRVGDPVSGLLLVSDGSEWYRLVTSGFLHYGLIHLGFNMLLLYQLGLELEPALGRARFALLYFASLLGGSAGVLLVDQGGIAAGASGAVFGLMGAYAVAMWQRGVNPFTTGIGSLLLINLFLTFLISNIAIGGHIGGAIAGSICGYVMLAPNHRAAPVWARWATPVAVAAASIAVSVVAASG